MSFPVSSFHSLVSGLQQVNFLETRRMDKEVSAAIRMGIGEILKEARLYMREKRLAHDGFQELQEVYARRLAQEKEDAMRNAKEMANVMTSVRAHCKMRATTQVEEEEARNRRMYRKGMPKRKRHARRRRNRMMKYAALLATIGAIEQIIVHSSRTGAVGNALLAMAFAFYIVAVVVVAYAHYHLGPVSVRPWLPTDPKLLHERIQLCAEDLLAKWENNQKHEKLKIKERVRRKQPSKMEEAVLLQGREGKGSIS